MLLTLESAIGDGIIDVFSHFASLEGFYRPFGVTVNRFQYFSSLNELWSLGVQSEPLPRTKYPMFKLPNASVEPPGDSPVIGIHIEGSSFSNDASRQNARPIKDMSHEFLGNLIHALNSKEAFPYIFCSPARRVEVHALFKNYYRRAFKVIAFDDIWTSLACVAHCDVVLATDSAIKTMAAILRIPSIVLVGDYPDPFRDEVFLQPYVTDGLMHLVKFRDIDTLDPREIVTSALAQSSRSRTRMFLRRPIPVRSALPLLHQRTI